MLLRQTLLYLPAQTVVPLSQLVAAFLWTYWLGPEAMGTYAIIWSVQELIYLVVLSWWSIYCLRYANGLITEDKGQDFDQTESAVQLYGSVVQAVAAIAAIAVFAPQELGWATFLATLAFTLTRNISTHFATRARAQLEAVPYSLNLGTGSVLGLIFGLAAVIWWEATPEALLFAYSAAQALGLAISLPFMKVLPRRPAADPAILRQAAEFGVPLMVSSALTWAGNHAVRFIVEFGAGRAAVGLMTVGWWMGLRIAAFAGLLVMGAAFNVAVERHRTGGTAAGLQQVATNAALLLGILVPAVIGIWLVGGQVVHLLVAEAYRQSTAAILPIAVCAGAARTFREHGVDPVFMIFEKPRLPAFNAMIDALGTVAFCSAGLYVGGVTGAAWGCFAASAVGALAAVLLARVRLGYYIEWSGVSRICAASMCMALPLLLLPKVVSSAVLAASILGSVAIYATVLGALYPSAAARHAGRGWSIARRFIGAKR